ncbi:ATP-dependent nuclease [Microbacterium sp. NPDC055312]
MGLSYRFTSITLTSGQELQLLGTGVTCVVGANNTGKSQLLKDMVETVRGQMGVYYGPDSGERGASRSVVREASFIVDAHSEQDIIEWASANTLAVGPSHAPGNVILPPSQNQTHLSSIASSVTSSAAGNGLQYLTDSFVRRIPAGGAMAYAAGELRTDQNPDSLRNWLIRRLHENGELEAEFSATVERLFAVPCFVDRVGFPPRLRAGHVLVDPPPVNALTAEYADAVNSCPPLDDQGDGLRSFAGLALVTMALSPSVLLLDEPESFLHPAQARAVGRWLAASARDRGMQVVVATHDRDFLIGLLNGSKGGGLEILRLTRAEEGARARQLESTDLNAYWTDPTLRYSNVLQGLFHERVVVCEGDRDCRFYGAAADELATSLDKQHVADNTLFIPSSGTGGFAKLLNVLRDLNVTASVITDFDFLDDRAKVEATLAALGATWDESVNAAWLNAMRHIERGKEASFWKKVHNGGLDQVPAGVATKDFRALLGELAVRRLHVLPVGELEDFHREEGKGAAWVGSALDAEAHRSASVQSLLSVVIPELKA